MPGPKTNEREGTRAVLRHSRMSAYKVREVLDLIRGQDVDRAEEVLRFCERDAATVVGKVLHSAMANAEHNEGVPNEELFVSACYADEGPTLKRWRPRARGRATRIRKRTCHVTVIVTRLPESEVRKRRAARAPTATERRRRRSGAAPSPERERRVRASRRQPAETAPASSAGPEPAPKVAPEPDVVDADAGDADAGDAIEIVDDAPTPEPDDERTE